MKTIVFVVLFSAGLQLQSVSQDVGIIYKAEGAEEGDGAELLRLFPSASFKHADPFILLDDFSVQPPAGFPPHEHKGFEAITYMIDGGFVHKDNLGNNDTIFAGGAQHFTAGKGLVHSEMPSGATINKGLQLWLNIPDVVKGSAPTYQSVETLPVESTDKTRIVRTIVGESSPLKVDCACDLSYLDVQLNNSMVFSPVRGYTSFVYVIEGVVLISGRMVYAGRFYFLESGIETEVSGENARFVYLSAKPLSQKIKQRGPYVY